MQKPLIHWRDFILLSLWCGLCLQERYRPGRTKCSWQGQRRGAFGLCRSLIQRGFYKMKLYVILHHEGEDVRFSSRRSNLSWSSCPGRYLFFLPDLPPRCPPRALPLSAIPPLESLSCSWIRGLGLIQIWYTSWEGDYGSVPSTGIQKIQAG